jgi:hypothetical protein
MIDESDLKRAKLDAANTLEKRSLRILDEEIGKLERTLSGLRFVRDTLARLDRRQHVKE